jgi:hypothetical protein
MRFDVKRAGLTAATLALVAAAACSNKAQPIDSSLKADLDAVAGSSLELAPTGAKAQVVVSSIEQGPQASPAAASRAPVAKPAPRAPKKAAARTVRQPAPAPARQTVADVAPEPQPVQQAPATIEQPAPVQRPTAPQRQSGTYKTEAEIFRQMPWIRP